MQATKGRTSLVSHGLQTTPEVRDPIRLNVKGSVPHWLRGKLYRTGPGTYEVPLDSGGTFHVRHWFDGFGMTHKFEIKEGGEVWYRNRKVCENLEKDIASTGECIRSTFASVDPCESTFHKFFTIFKRAVSSFAHTTDHPTVGFNNTSVTISPDMPGATPPSSHSSSKQSRPSYIVVKTDADLHQILDPDTLEPLATSAYNKMHPKLAGSVMTGSHACTDPINRDFFNFVEKFGRTPSYSVFRIRGSGAERGKVDILAEFSDAPMAYIHSSCLTEKYYVLCIGQAHIPNPLSIVINRNLLDGIDPVWNPKRPALFYVIDRERGGVVAKYKCDPFFNFHVVNSYDEGDDIIIDLAAFDDHKILYSLSKDQMEHPWEYPPIPKATLRRFRLRNVSSRPPDAEAAVSFRLPESKTIELPVVSPNHYHRKYRYAYGISIAGGTETVLSDQLIKLDMEHPSISGNEGDVLADGSAKVWREEDCVPGEPIFVPRPGGTAEDDGVILSVVLDGKGVANSLLIVLDAKDMKELARAEMDTPFPIGFHGVFV